MFNDVENLLLGLQFIPRRELEFDEDRPIPEGQTVQRNFLRSLEATWQKSSTI
jgi:hypothetical protein